MRDRLVFQLEQFYFLGNNTMTTATTTSVLDQTTDVAFRNWVAEVIAQLTAVGLTQTSDTGQINTSTVTRVAGLQTAAGYAIFRFNDSLQSTSPIFMKFEFGTGSIATTCPGFWVTVGTGSNGSGTITGVTTGRCPVAINLAQVSSVTNYISRYFYSATLGVLWFSFKLGGCTGGVASWGFFYIARSNNGSGTPSADSYLCITNQNSVTLGAVSNAGTAFNYSYNTGAQVATPSNPLFWSTSPYTLSSTLVNGNFQIFPAFHLQPTISMCAFLGTVLITELPVGNTISIALVGATPVTFINPGQYSNSAAPGGSDSNACVLLPWQ